MSVAQASKTTKRNDLCTLTIKISILNTHITYNANIKYSQNKSLHKKKSLHYLRLAKLEFCVIL